MGSFDVWLRQQIMLAYLVSITGNPRPASVIVGEVDQLVDYVRTGCRLKAPEENTD